MQLVWISIQLKHLDEELLFEEPVLFKTKTPAFPPVMNIPN